MTVGPILYFDAEGTIIATLDVCGLPDAGNGPRIADFASHEANGGRLRDFGDLSWTDAEGVHHATGAGAWPEWIGGAQAAEFRVEMDPHPAPARARILALVHRTSGHRRERAAIEAAIDAVVPNADGAKDIRHLVGGPDRPLALDSEGRTGAHKIGGTPAHLPLMGLITDGSTA